MNKNQAIFDYLNRKNPIKPPKTNIKAPGSLIEITTFRGKELAIVLYHVSRNDLWRYLRTHDIEYDKSNKYYSYHYSILGHFKEQDVQESVKGGKEPQLQLLIVKVSSKTEYNVIAGNDPDLQTLFEAIRDMAKSDKSIPTYIDKLYNVIVMKLATDDMKRSFKQGLTAGDIIKRYQDIDSQDSTKDDDYRPANEDSTTDSTVNEASDSSENDT